MKAHLKPKSRLDLGPRPPCPACGMPDPWKSTNNWLCRNPACAKQWRIVPPQPRKYQTGPGLPPFEERPQCDRCGHYPVSHRGSWECPDCGHYWKKSDRPKEAFEIPQQIEVKDA